MEPLTTVCCGYRSQPDDAAEERKARIARLVEQHSSCASGAAAALASGAVHASGTDMSQLL